MLWRDHHWPPFIYCPLVAETDAICGSIWLHPTEAAHTMPSRNHKHQRHCTAMMARPSNGTLLLTKIGPWDDVMKWNIFRVTGRLCGEFTGHRWIPSQRSITRALMFSLNCSRINGWVNKREADDLRRYRPHYDVIVMIGISMFY